MNIRLLGQAVLQLFGLKYATVKYRKEQIQKN